MFFGVIGIEIGFGIMIGFLMCVCLVLKIMWLCGRLDLFGIWMSLLMMVGMKIFDI